MKITLEDQLANLIEGVINKITTEIDYSVKDNGEHLIVDGVFLVIREIKINSRTTEIKDYMPINISLPKKNLINKKEEVFLYLDGFRFEFDLKRTRVYVDLELSNIDNLYSNEEHPFVLGVLG